MKELEEAAARVVREYTAAGKTLGAAESLTGGMICASVAGVSGASAVLMGGVVSYDPRVKREVLGVSLHTVETLGVVSRACAMEMAAGARRLLKTDVAVSATGVAGPSGGTEENPVGTVWLGVSTAQGERALRFQFEGDRQSVREQSATEALTMALDALARA